MCQRVSSLGFVVFVASLFAGSSVCGQAPANIQPESTKKVKKATVYLKVEMADGVTAEGSGFFAMERGIVLTNAHVVGMLAPNSKAPKKIDIVGNSGQKDEFKMTGLVLGVDRNNDLAIVRVEGEEKRWPESLTVEFNMSDLVELQKVYIFGFPLGAELGKEITASESSISSFRKDLDGFLYQIQVNGGMHPGNSGGPVVDTRGVVVGVAVAGIRGTQINFAVPGEKVQGLVHGRVQETLVGLPFRDAAKIKLPLKVVCLDPLQRIKAVEVDVWTAPPGKPRPASLQAPAVLPGDAKKQTVSIKYDKGQASHDIQLGADLPQGHVYWLQPVFVNQAGVKQWGATSNFKPTDSPPLDRVDANLTANIAPGERSLKLSTRSVMRMTRGKEKHAESDIMNLEVLETLSNHPKGANLGLVWGKGQFLEEFNGKRVPRRPAAYASIRNHVHGFACNETGGLITFGFVKFNFKDPLVNQDANDMVHFFLSSYQFVSLPLPNREVKPQESWPVKIRLLMGREKKKDVMDVVLTCTYEGTRTVNDRKEAVISLLGEINVLKSERPLLRQPSDRAFGLAVFDVEKGFVSKLKIALSDERDFGGITVARIFEADMTRVPGNPFNINNPAKPKEKPNMPPSS